jgi:outer membrane protein assembly factor BamB
VAIRQTTICCCSAVALIALLASSGRAQTSVPAARAVKQNRSADDKTPLPLFPVASVWTLALNNALTAPPAFRGSLAVFALEGEQIVAYDLSKGSRLWLTTITTNVEPAIGTNEVFIADDGGISALSLSSGELVWRQPFADTLATPPVVDRDRLILTTSSGDIVALRASDGMELWRQHLPAAPSSRPAVSATRAFVATADKQVVALNSDDGAVVWSRMLGGVGHDILPGDDRIFLGASDRVFYCLNTKDGEVAWRWPTGADAIGVPSADDRVVYFVSLDNLLRALNRSNGVQQWKSALAFRPISGPLKWSETLVVAGTEPVLQGFSTREGRSLGRYPVSTELSAQPYLFVDNSRVFPVLVTISADIVGRATVTGATRDIEPAQLPLAPLPNVVPVPTSPAAPRVLEVVSPLPNLIRVDPAARP